MGFKQTLSPSGSFLFGKREEFYSWVSRPIFVHFLDRELLTSFHVYSLLPIPRVLHDVRLALLSTYEPLYFSASVVFESKFAQAMLKHLQPMFQSGQIQLSVGQRSLSDYIETKREQYAHQRERYPLYFSDEWQRLSGMGPTFTAKNKDTTEELELSLTREIESGFLLQTAERIVRGADPHELTRLSPFVAGALHGRGRSAITSALLQKPYERLNASEAGRMVFDRKLSEHYVLAYIADYDGTIITGLSGGVFDFTYIAPTYPFHHLSVWYQLYSRLGIWHFLRSLDGETLCFLRETPDYQRFIDAARWLMARLLAVAEERRWYTASPHLGLERLLRAQLMPVARRPNSLSSLFKTMRVYEEILESLAAREIKWGDKGHQYLGVKPMRDTVFVTYGRNDDIRREIFAVLRAAGLIPLEFGQGRKLTGKTSPYIGEILEAMFRKAKAFVVIFSDDELAQLRDEYRQSDDPIGPEPQPRPNVILEAGMALGKNPDGTIIVQAGKIRKISDLLGRHVIYWDGSIDKRLELLQRLHDAGCDVDLSGRDWMTVTG